MPSDITNGRCRSNQISWQHGVDWPDYALRRCINRQDMPDADDRHWRTSHRPGCSFRSETDTLESVYRHNKQATMLERPMALSVIVRNG